MSQSMRQYVLIIIAVACGLSSAQSSCVTPDPYILSLLRPNLSAADRNILQRSQCGYFGYIAVCCPSSPPAAQQPTFPQQNQGGQTQSTGLQASDLPQPGVCGTHLADRIVGGHVAPIDAYPWMVLIEHKKPNGRGFHCGGVLVSENYVLTAAHCVAGKDLLALRWTLSGVRLGEYDLKKSPDCEEDSCADPVLDVPVVERTVHENYVSGSKTQENDIALLRLGRSVPFTDWVKLICLPISQNIRNREYSGFPLIVAGWGKTENKSTSDVKWELQLDGVSLNDCNNVYRLQNVLLSQGQMCAGGQKGKDSCRGDSGGPLMAVDNTDRFNPYYYLAGVVSFVDWILSHMRR